MSKDDNREAKPKSDLPEQGEAFAQRRQVIRGMASIPVALTLSSGAALANASSHACLTNETTPQAGLPACSDSDIPGWADADVNTSGSGDPKYCVAYATESPPGTLVVTGYSDPSSSTGFVDADGNEISGVIGNPLRASCATSFMH